MKKFIYYLTTLLGLFTTINAQDCNDLVHTGEGTFYGGIAGSSGGNCSLPVDAGDIYHCALNNIDYNNSNACGACIKVTGPKGSVVLKVVDRCPECAEGDVDLTQGAFEQVADIIDGRVDIEWEFVPCSELENQENIKINFKSGSSQYWTAIQFRNIEHAIVNMEYKLTNGTWQSVDRVLFNFYIETSGIPTPMDLRVTSVLGETLIFENVAINTENDYDTGLQFSTPETCLNSNTEEEEEEEEEEEIIEASFCPEFIREELVGKTVRIQNKATTLFTQISGTANNSNVRLANSNNTGTWTQWAVEENIDGGIYYYGFRNIASGKRLRGNASGGIELGTTSSTGTWTQWIVTTENGTDYQLFNRKWQEYYSAGNNVSNARLELASISDSENSLVIWNFLNVNNNESVIECNETTRSQKSIATVSNENLTFSMSPNPATNFVTFTNVANLDIENNELIIRCTNMLGQNIIFNTEIINGAAKIDISNLTPGMYFIKVTNSTGITYTDKLVVQ